MKLKKKHRFDETQFLKTRNFILSVTPLDPESLQNPKLFPQIE